MNLLIDDMKSGQGWDMVARNAEVAKRILQHFADIDCLGIDFDLGGLCSGYDILKWAWEKHYLPAKVEIVSFNPVGRKAIENFLIHDAGYVLINGTYCRRDNMDIERKQEEYDNLQDDSQSQEVYPDEYFDDNYEDYDPVWDDFEENWPDEDIGEDPYEVLS